MRRWIVCLTGWGMLLGSVGAAQADTAMGEPIDFVQAGVRIAFPADFTSSVPQNSICLYVAGKAGAKLREQAGLYAVVNEGAAPATSDQTVAEQIADGVVKRGGVENFRQTSSEAVHISGLSGWWTVATYRPQGARSAECLVVTTWNVPRPKQGRNLQFALEVRTTGNEPHTKALADAILKTVQTIDLQPPWEGPMPPMTSPVKLDSLGLTMTLPQSWHILQAGPLNETTYVLLAAVGNYLTGVMPRLSCRFQGLSKEDRPDFHSKAYVEALLEQEARRRAKFHWKLGGYRFVQVGQQNALEFWGEVTPKQQKFFLIERRLVWEGRECVFQFSYPAEAQKRAKEMMEKLSETVRFEAPK
jgi:hypothetical protein